MPEEYRNSRRKNRPNKIGKEMNKPVYFEVPEDKKREKQETELPDIFEKKLDIEAVSPLEELIAAKASKNDINGKKFTEKEAKIKLDGDFPRIMIDLSLEHNPFEEPFQKKGLMSKLFGSGRREKQKVEERIKKRFGKPLSYAGIFIGFLTLSWVISNAPALLAQFQYNVGDSGILAPTPDVQAETETPKKNKNVYVSGPDKIIIPSLRVDAPIVWSEKTSEKGIQKDLERGVVHYGNTPLPGQAGNTVFFGHSSYYMWAPGKYKHVFALLPKIKKDDKIVIHYSGKKYVYRVSKIQEVSPKEIKVLKSTGATPKVSLIACTPVGTALKRIVVEAVQISPKAGTPVSDLPHLPAL